MIKFKNKTFKIIFYVVYALLTLINLLMVINAYVEPSSSMGLLLIIFMQIQCLLLPLLLLIFLFTHPTPHKKRADKMVRLGVWIPISTFLALSVLASVLMAFLTGNRCEDIGPNGKLWGCDFEGADLSGVDLSEADMSEINLSGANLSGSNLSGAELSRANLTNSNLAGADLSDARMFNATLDGADLSNAVLDGAGLSGASLIGVTGLTDESLANLEQWEGMLLQSEDQILAELWQVCKGIGIENAAAYDSDLGATSIVLITDVGERHPTTEYVPRNWWPASVSNAELVACFDSPYRVAKGTCTYDDGTSWDRYSQRIDISIFIARTGDLLEKITLEGPAPGACPENIVAGGERPEDLGDAPYGVQIIEALTPFAHEGGDLHPPRLP